jgi:hypothetical protein
MLREHTMGRDEHGEIVALLYILVIQDISIFNMCKMQQVIES